MAEPALHLAATGHVFAGLCPDHTQPQSRDCECGACQLLLAAESRARAAYEDLYQADSGDPSQSERLAEFIAGFNAALATLAKSAGVRAWETQDDPHRVISAAQKATAERDGGASASSVRSYSVPLIRAGVALDQATKPGEPAAARAFAIADEAMFEHLHSYGVIGGKDRDVIGLCGNDLREVAAFAEASDVLREAVEWLQPRGYVRVEKDR